MQPSRVIEVGRFRVFMDQLIGRGAYAAVYRAETIDTGRPLAAKLLRPELAEDAAHRKRFLREAGLAVQLDPSRSIVEVLGVETATIETVEGPRECLFLFMEYIEGRTLGDLLDERGRLEPREALAIMEQIAVALEEAAHKGIVHRDIKPHNVMIDGEGRVKVADFGLARLAEGDSTITRTGIVQGTPAYISPEQIGQKNVDWRADLYSAGCVFYHLLVGRAPFDGNSMVVMRAHGEEQPIPPSRLAPDVPPAIERIVLRCLRKAPEDRYGSPVEFRAALACTSTVSVEGSAAPTDLLDRAAAQKDLPVPLEAPRSERDTCGRPGRLSRAAALILFACFFLPMVRGCNKDESPYTYLVDIATPPSWGGLWLSTAVLAPHLLALAVVGAGLRAARKPRLRAWVFSSLAVITFSSGSFHLAVWLDNLLSSPKVPPGTVLPSAWTVLIVQALEVAGALYLLAGAHPDRLRACAQFAGGVHTVIWFGVWIGVTAPADRLFGLWLAFASSWVLVAGSLFDIRASPSSRDTS